MKNVRFGLVVLLCCALALSLVGLGACSTTEESEQQAVAATVNGHDIYEQDITDSIEGMRAQNVAYADSASWAQALQDASYTPESLRESVIDSKVREVVINQQAESEGYTIDEEAIDAQLEETKATIGGDEATWLAALQKYNYKDEQAYRTMLESSSLSTQLYEGYSLEPTNDELAEYIATNPTAVEGYSITGEAAPEDTAAEDDASAATEGEGAGDSATAEGDGTGEAAADGTTADDTAADATTPETEGASTDDTSATGEATTPTYTAADVDLSTMSQDIRDQFTEHWLQANKGTRYEEWISELIESADVVINDMPEDVSYNVDMSLAESAEDTTEDETASPSSPEAINQAISEGLVITDEVVGEGAEATEGATVRVLYTGTLTDGTVFDTTANRDNEPYEFVVGAGTVIRGWDAGLVGMKVGGKRHLTVPASLGYGDQEKDTIPPNSVLEFDIELVEVVTAQ